MESLYRAVKLTLYYSVQMKSAKQIDITGTVCMLEERARLWHSESEHVHATVTPVINSSKTSTSIQVKYQ